jgi:hypothetical protein
MVLLQVKEQALEACNKAKKRQLKSAKNWNAKKTLHCWAENLLSVEASKP